MPRGPQHSKNWGGKREGAGRKFGSQNKFQKNMAELAEKFDLHPVELLLQVVNDSEQSLNMRLNAAVHVLPYVTPRQAAIAVTQVDELEHMTEEQKMARIAALMQRVEEKRPALTIEGESAAAT